MVCTKSLKVFYAEHNPEMCYIFALCDSLMFGYNLYVFLLYGETCQVKKMSFEILGWGWWVQVSLHVWIFCNLTVNASMSADCLLCISMNCMILPILNLSQNGM